MAKEPQQLTKEMVGRKIREALSATGKSPEWLASEAGISLSSLNRYMKGTHDPSAIEVWRISRATRKEFGWFAGERDPAPERLATATERAEATIRSMQAALSQLLADLAAARSLVGDDPHLDPAIGKQAVKKRGKAVAVPREAAG